MWHAPLLKGPRLVDRSRASAGGTCKIVDPIKSKLKSHEALDPKWQRDKALQREELAGIVNPMKLKLKSHEVLNLRK